MYYVERSAYSLFFVSRLSCKRDELHRARIVSRFQLTTPEALLQWLLDKNNILGEEREQRWGAPADTDGKKKKEGKAWASALEKANKFGFYLGLDKRWIEGEIAMAEAQLEPANEDVEDEDEGEEEGGGNEQAVGGASSGE